MLAEMVHAHTVQAGTPLVETPVVAKIPGGRKDKPEKKPAMAEDPGAFFRQQRGATIAKSCLSIKTYWRRPIQALFLTERSLLNSIKSRLHTIHPNPGPGRTRNKTEEGRKNRRDRRYEKRKEKRKARENIKQTVNITTWNVQRMSLGTMYKRKARNVVKKAQDNEWEVVLLSEVRAEREGVEWIGEGENLAAIIYTKKAGILLRGKFLTGWTQGGQRKFQSDRT